MQVLSVVGQDEFLQGAKIVVQGKKRMFFRGTYTKWLFKVFQGKFYVAMGGREEKAKTHTILLQHR